VLEWSEFTNDFGGYKGEFPRQNRANGTVAL
jgi:hypothetical protein